MQIIHADAVVEKDGKIRLDHLPFPEGAAVHVFISSAAPITFEPLKGSVLKYEQPFAPAAEDDWDAAQREDGANRTGQRARR